MREDLDPFLWETLQALPYHPMHALPSPPVYSLAFLNMLSCRPLALNFVPFSFTSLFIIGLILSVPWFPACVPCKVLFFSLLLWSYYFRLFARLSSLPLPALHPGTAARVSGCFFSYLLTGLLHLLKAFAYNLSRFCYFHYAVMYCYFIPMSLCVCVCVVCTCMCVYWGRIFLV